MNTISLCSLTNPSIYPQLLNNYTSQPASQTIVYTLAACPSQRLSSVFNNWGGYLSGFGTRMYHRDHGLVLELMPIREEDELLGWRGSIDTFNRALNCLNCTGRVYGWAASTNRTGTATTATSLIYYIRLNNENHTIIHRVPTKCALHSTTLDTEQRAMHHSLLWTTWNSRDYSIHYIYKLIVPVTLKYSSRNSCRRFIKALHQTDWKVYLKRIEGGSFTSIFSNDFLPEPTTSATGRLY